MNRKAYPEKTYKSDYKSLRLHPYKIMLFLVLLSISMLFFGMTMAYLYQRIEKGIEPVNLPFIFIINALILLGSSVTLNYAKKAYQEDDTEGYKRHLTFTLGLTLLFAVAQAYAWIWMRQNNLFPSTGPAVGYLYALAILHLTHIFAGLPFFVLFLRTAIVRMKEPMSVLLYFSDPEKKLKLRLLSVYWHYLDGLWWYLVLFFIINSLIF